MSEMETYLQRGSPSMSQKAPKSQWNSISSILTLLDRKMVLLSESYFIPRHPLSVTGAMAKQTVTVNLQ